MANINPLVDFSSPVSRQDLYDMWNTGSFSTITVDDFEEGFLPILVGSTFSDAPTSPQPGQLYWHQTENLMFCWHDVVDGTGVSLWLAIGPDRFDTAVLLQNVAAVGEALELVGPGRTVKAIESNGLADRLEIHPIAGWNQANINAPPQPNGAAADPVLALSNGSGETYWMGETSVSGSWIPMAIDGICWMGSAPGSHPSSQRTSWTTTGPSGLNEVQGIGSGIIGNVGTTSAVVPAHPVAGVWHWGTEMTSAARTEPWWLARMQICGRAYLNNWFAI